MHSQWCARSSLANVNDGVDSNNLPIILILTESLGLFFLFGPFYEKTVYFNFGNCWMHHMNC